MKVHETRSHSRASAGEGKVQTRKQKAEKTEHEAGHSPKKPKPENDNGQTNRKAAEEILAEFEEFCKAIRENLSIQQMREILEANGQDSSGPDSDIIARCQDLLFFGPLEKCPVCNGNLEFARTRYICSGFLSEWSSCTFSTKDPPRKQEPTKIPDSVLNSPVTHLIKKYQDPSRRPRRNVAILAKPFTGIMICLTGRLSRTHDYWRKEIEKLGGKVSNSVIGVTCLVASPAERERGGSTKLADALEGGIPVVSEAWFVDSIKKKEPQPLEAYDIASDFLVEGKGIPWDKQDPSEEALESLMTELKIFGKRGVHKDSKLQEEGGEIFERDGILYNCAFSLCNLGRGLNDYCVLQLITVPDSGLHLYYKKGRVGDDPNAEESLEELDTDEAVKEFVRIFEEVTGNEFEPWEREKKFQKKPLKFYPVDMDDGVEVRHGGLRLRQLGAAVAHCKLDPFVANLMKVLCSQGIYRYALMEMGYDPPDIPTGMATTFHLKKCEEALLEYIEKVKSIKETGQKAEAVRSDYSQRWFTLMQSTRPFILKEFREIADHAAAALESIRDINVASHIIGDMSGSTLDDPLSERYEKLGCSVSPLDKNSEEYQMITKYLEKTYEPVVVGAIEYDVTAEYIFEVESNAMPSYDEIKKLPNKVLLWCGTRSSNVMRHLHQGFLPAICHLPVPGYMFGRAIVCSDASAEAARFTAVDRPEGFLVLAIASLGDNVAEVKKVPQDTKSLEEKKIGVKGLGRKKPNESEHFVWKDNIKVPCGHLVPSDYKESPLEYNEYAVYDPKLVSMQFVVQVRFQEKDVVMVAEEP
ncbi:Poly [ADP-ribose] polymerase 3 [Morella rubra]|uniref:Poly [ADP-ribose] polymerase n=1 Tax=Morella rubra TaxID=262757 RepID=A0A6A1WRD5_9ROSI|nr:Poly [ADP-ribose] polymerase 3 [Morella rubra]